jgi:hypothetical protein
VAISRVRTLSDLAFVRKIGAERLKKLGGISNMVVDLHRRQSLPFRYVEGTFYNLLIVPSAERKKWTGAEYIAIKLGS